MKISRLIKELQKFKNKHGDLPVYGWYEEEIFKIKGCVHIPISDKDSRPGTHTQPPIPEHIEFYF